eukprot:6476626-Amphidinium_carterae.1
MCGTVLNFWAFGASVGFSRGCAGALEHGQEWERKHRTEIEQLQASIPCAHRLARSFGVCVCDPAMSAISIQRMMHLFHRSANEISWKNAIDGIPWYYLSCDGQYNATSIQERLRPSCFVLHIVAKASEVWVLFPQIMRDTNKQ